MLVGRELERARVDTLLDAARDGRSGVLVICGEPGIGKTALLDYAIGRADGMTVVRALGLESEAELEFSGLLDVCRPLLRHLDEIPERQAVALRAALGIEGTAELDGFAVGAATLSVLATAAEANPLLVIVDDAHWVDRSSRDAILFAARRLVADRVAVIYATRDDVERTLVLPPGVDSVALKGLPRDDAVSLLRGGPAEMAPEVANRIYETTAGNPLALIELPTLLSPEQLDGTAPLDDPLPAGSSIERAFGRRVESLPVSTRKALLIAAASSSSRVATITEALKAVEVDGAAALEEAEDAGFVTITGDTLVFRHPLARSAVYHMAAPSERRHAHRILADALDGRATGEERAWHLAAAALGPDEEVASALGRAAADVKERVGLAAAAPALERAAHLTPDVEQRRLRLADAAEASWHAGHRDTALALARAALEGCEEPELRSRMLHLQGLILHVAGSVQEASQVLLEAAGLLDTADPPRAAAILADAVEALTYSVEPTAALEAARRARGFAPEDGTDADFLAAFAMGQALMISGRAAEATRHLERALELVATNETLSNTPRRLVVASGCASLLERLDEGITLAHRAVALYRERGDVGLLPSALDVSARLLMRASRWSDAYAEAAEAIALARESDQTTTVFRASTTLARIDAYRGDEASCRRHVTEAESILPTGGLLAEDTRRTLGLLELSLGRFKEAIATLEHVDGTLRDRGYHDCDMAVEPDLVEAYVRLGRSDEAEAVLERYLSFGALVSPAYSTAVIARCRGILASEHEFDAAFEEALVLSAASADAVRLARTQLLFGERLRRAGRRVESRAQLRAALEAFEQLGAEPWAERTRTELRASGERLRRRDHDEAVELTPQELQIARQVAEAKSNKEVGAALFLSPKTVEYHLQRIYRKLGMRSRAELIRWMAAKEDAVRVTAT